MFIADALCIFCKEFARDNNFAFDEDFCIDFLFNGKFKVGGKESDYVTRCGDFDAFKNGIASFERQCFYNFLKGIAQFVSVENNFHFFAC